MYEIHVIVDNLFIKTAFKQTVLKRWLLMSKYVLERTF